MITSRPLVALWIVAMGLCICSRGQAAPMLIGEPGFQRELTSDGKVWRTTKFISGKESISTQSDEFHIRMMDDREWTISDFVAVGDPTLTKEGEASVWTIRYQWPLGREAKGVVPSKVNVRYVSKPGERWIRKSLDMEFATEATIDRLEVERFSATGEATRGGRGEPVFLSGKWFFGLEYPAGHSRHTDGNTPKPDTHHYEMVGNYSFVDLDGRDREDHARAGLIRLFHFPGFAVKEGAVWKITSKSAVCGGGVSVESQFADYLQTIQKPDRSFTHYNNWFDPAGKSLKGDNFVNIFRDFKTAIAPYGVKIDAMVPDDGWQNRQSVYEPTPRDFPGGFADLVKLSEALRAEGTNLGLWLALDGTNSDANWGQTKGYAKAQANRYFSRYFGHYSLSSEAYRTQLEQQLRRLAGEAKVGYFKHDFNHLSDIGEGNGHPPTDRHGHEANVDAMIRLLHVTREVNPEVYQNLTNWVWFSPWWLMHGDALWMLAGDDGANGNWPELSVRAMATTDRDTFLWRMWGDAADRPLVPISRLMTHGIILNARHQLEGPGDGVREWADHVMMYYGRGIQMKEWYITPKVATPDHWKALCSIHRWAEKNFKALANTVYVGGRPDEGKVYGYIGWNDSHGVLVTRNPSAETQTLEIPFGPNSRPPLEYHSRVVFPYHDDSSPTFWSGRTIRIEIPGCQTLALEFDRGRAKQGAVLSAVPVKFSGSEVTTVIPADTRGRAEVLVIGYPELPEVKINGQVATPLRSSAAKLNPFPGYARAGMPSDKARPWKMASFDVKALIGKEMVLSIGSSSEGSTRAEAWLLMDRKGADASGDGKDQPWAIDAGLRRQTVCLIPEKALAEAGASRRSVSPDELSKATEAKLVIGLFGVNGVDFGEKSVWLNGGKVVALPVVGDAWKSISIPIDPKSLKPSNELEIRRSTNEDMFKFRQVSLRVLLADGTWLTTPVQEGTQTTDRDWAYFEGTAFPQPLVSALLTLEFKAE